MSHDATASAKNPLVYVTHGVVQIPGATPQSLTITAPLVVGSSTSAGLCLADNTVSRIHAELVPEKDGLWVRDLGSRNGTFVSGIRVHSARIPDKARVTFGEFSVDVRYERTAEARDESQPTAFGPLLGTSDAMRRCFGVLAQAAASEASILISGETGVGKDVVAQAIHGASPRADGRFVVVDCAALPESILESELFGHARGAFTGAVSAREGAFEAARGGTVFIDEVGELPLALQPKLLRVLEARTVRRIGETDYRPIDARIVAATHRDLRAMVNAGTFREDLYFRLAVLPIHVPPMRERREDIEPLLSKFLGRPAQQVVTPAQLRELERAPWPGNVRELRNFAERVLAVGLDRALELSRGDLHLADAQGPILATVEPVAAEPSGALGSLQDHKERAERDYLVTLLRQHGDNLSQAARVAGIARAHMYRLMRRWNL